MIGYIYKTTNLKNGKIYIGQKLSATFDPTYYGSGIALKKAISNYGKENFKIEILYKAESLKRLDDAEIFFIEDSDAINDKIGYNKALGGKYKIIEQNINGPIEIKYDKYIECISCSKNQKLFMNLGITNIKELFLADLLFHIYKTKQYIDKIGSYFFINYKTILAEIPTVFKNTYSLYRLLDEIKKRPFNKRFFTIKYMHNIAGTQTYFKLNLQLYKKIGVKI